MSHDDGEKKGLQYCSETPKKTLTRKEHFYLAAATVYYERDGFMKERTLNAALSLPSKTVTNYGLQNVQKAVILRVCEENKVDREQIKDVVLLNLNYLGHMTLKEFNGA